MRNDSIVNSTENTSLSPLEIILIQEKRKTQKTEKSLKMENSYLNK